MALSSRVAGRIVLSLNRGAAKEARSSWAVAARGCSGEIDEVRRILHPLWSEGLVSLSELTALGAGPAELREPDSELPTHSPVVVLRRHSEPSGSTSLTPIGQIGAAALAACTPVDQVICSPLTRTRLTADEWSTTAGVDDRFGLPPGHVEREVGVQAGFAAWAAHGSEQVD